MGDVKFFIVVDVDDRILVCNNKDKFLQVKEQLFRKFKMKDVGISWEPTLCTIPTSVWEALCRVHEAKTIGNKFFLRRRFFTIKMKEEDDMLVHINTVKALADQLRSIEVNITDEHVYMVLLMSLPPSFDNLITSLESMSIKDVDLQFIVPRLFHKVSKRKECDSSETIA